MAAAIINIDQTAQAGCQSAVEHKAIVPKPQHRKHRLADLNPQLGFATLFGFAGNLQPFTNFFRQKFQHIRLLINQSGVPLPKNKLALPCVLFAKRAWPPRHSVPSLANPLEPPK